jgi:hypothetical protein
LHIPLPPGGEGKNYLFGLTPESRSTRLIAILNYEHDSLQLLNEVGTNVTTKLLGFLSANCLGSIPLLAKLSLKQAALSPQLTDLRRDFLQLVPPVLADNLACSIDICYSLSQVAVVAAIPAAQLSSHLARAICNYTPNTSDRSQVPELLRKLLKPPCDGAPPELAQLPDYSSWRRDKKAAMRCFCKKRILLDIPDVSHPDLTHIVAHLYNEHIQKNQAEVLTRPIQEYFAAGDGARYNYAQ